MNEGMKNAIRARIIPKARKVPTAIAQAKLAKYGLSYQPDGTQSQSQGTKSGGSDA